MINVQNLTKSFHDRAILNGVSLDVKKGDLIAIIGPSGCGKSTFLRCLNGLEKADTGTITTSGRIGMVFQSFNLFPHLTVLENLTLAPKVVSEMPRNAAHEKALHLLAKVGLGDKANFYPDKLSGGQQQRAAIARALCMQPEILLYDEPTSALDPSLVNEVLKVMKDLKNDGMTQIVVTHEMRFARDVADQIVFMDQGKIVEMGPSVEIFARPREIQTQKFLSHFQ